MLYLLVRLNISRKREVRAYFKTNVGAGLPACPCANLMKGQAPVPAPSIFIS